MTASVNAEAQDLSAHTHRTHFRELMTPVEGDLRAATQ